MFRLVGQPFSFRHRVRELVYKMLFLWSKEPEPNPPRGNPWFAWLTTAILVWGCRRRILRTFSTFSPSRLMNSKLLMNLNINIPISMKNAISKISKNSLTNNNERKKMNLIVQPKNHVTTIKTKIKRLGTGDGLHVSNNTNNIQSTQHVHYKMTRSGRIYGKYPQKIATSM